MQTMFVGPKHAEALAFGPVSGDERLTNAYAMPEGDWPLTQPEGRQPFKRRLYFAVKRLLDLTLTILALGFLWPLLLLIAVAIKLDSPGPIIEAQARIGVRRRRHQGQLYWTPVVFPLYRFRTTSVPAAQAHTLIGGCLRQTGLDQLPQLWNIIRGDLTLVGPRPVLPVEFKSCTPGHQRRFTTMPGMTGLWQLCTPCPPVTPIKRSQAAQQGVTFEQMVQLDLEYIEKQSLGLDVRILGNTVLAILRSPIKFI